MVQVFTGWSQCPSCYPGNSVKALKETQSPDLNEKYSEITQWPFLIHKLIPKWRGRHTLMPAVQGLYADQQCNTVLV